METVTKKYVDCKTILEQIIKIKNDFSPTVRPMLYVFKHILSETPAADVAPVKHGHWTGIEGDVCSECGTSLTEIMDADSCFAIGFNPNDLVACPFCGATMDGGKKREVGFYRDPKNYNISQRLADGGNE